MNFYYVTFSPISLPNYYARFLRILLYYPTILLLFLCATDYSSRICAQDKGDFSGNLQLIARFFEPDSARGAINTPFYDYLFYGADAFLTLNYKVAGFDLGARYDIYHNSPTFNPTRETNGQAIARWYVAKKVGKLGLIGGYIYDQFGTGTIFRAYEARTLGIDQSLFGLEVSYNFNDNWRLKALTGRMKDQMDPDLATVRQYKPIIKGLNLDGVINIGTKVQILPGVSAISRTIDTKTMQDIVNEINGYVVEDRFEPKYNTYAAQFYNTLQVGRVSWYAEAALKTRDVLRNQNGVLFSPKQGTVLYSTLSYSQKGLGIILQGKYTKDFDFRVSPNEIRNKGLIHFLPPAARQNSGRLTARYNAATQLLGEWGIQADITATPKKGLTFNANFSNIHNLDTANLFREIYVEAEIKPHGKPWKSTIGVQTVDYNQLVYEQKGDFVNTLTPFAEFIYKFDKKKSLKTELSYMLTKRDYKLFGKTDPRPNELQDLGDWAWLLVEYNIAPHWSFSVADLYGIDKKLHYPTLFAAYTVNSSRFSLSYAKQPSGIVCTGGVCRFEPAFSGVRFDLMTTF